MAGLDMTMKVKSAEYRPCEIGGRKALFHRWVESDKVIIESQMLLKNETIDECIKLYNEKKFLHRGMTAKIIKSFYGLVEYEDGTMEKVDPEKIVFKDNREIFEENGGYE